MKVSREQATGNRDRILDLAGRFSTSAEAGARLLERPPAKNPAR